VNAGSRRTLAHSTAVGGSVILRTMLHKPVLLPPASAARHVAACAIAACLLSSVDASAQGAPGEQIAVYTDRQECLQAGVLNAEQCGIAFLNARAEFEEKAPRYRQRPGCERAHGTCAAQISTSESPASRGLGAVSYVPAFRGVALLRDKQGALVVLPEIAGGEARAGFAPRSATQASAQVARPRPVIGDAPSPPRGSGTRPQPARGDRDDTIPMKLPKLNPADSNKPGLYVDEDGVEWYRPPTRRQ
jgi:hypothetical protein